MKIKSIKEVKNLSGQRVLVRVDFNVPLHKGRVESDYKIRRSLPTIQWLLQKGAKVILVSHLGRPEGKKTAKFSLKPVAKYLSKLLQKKVPLAEISTVSDWKKLVTTVSKMENGSLLFLENIRFLKDEESDGQSLAKALAGLADIFVLDGFAVAHRQAASVTGVAKYLPSFAGLLLYEEVSVLSKVLERPKRPLTVLIGGAKVETKIPVIKKLLEVADQVLISGGIFNTLLASEGKTMGKSAVDKEWEKEIQSYCQNKKIIKPVDVIVGTPDGKAARIVAASEVNVDQKNGVYDIGPETVQLFSRYFKKAGTIVWNGSAGMFEQPPYQFGTFSLARLLAGRSKGHAVGVCGGGETVEILEKLKLMSDIDLVSTGGGAMLEFLSGKKLPGLQALI